MPYFLLPIDALLSRSYDIRPLRNGSLLRINFHTFRGRPILLPDGTEVTRTDRVAELHLDNWRANREADYPWHVLGVMRSELKFLANEVSKLKVKALYGTTLHHAGAKRLGFTVRDISPLFRRWLVRLFLTGLLVSYHPKREQRLEKGRTPLEVKEVWISSAELLHRYS